MKSRPKITIDEFLSMSQKELASTDIEEMKSWDNDQWFQYLCKDGLLDINEVLSKFNEVLELTENQ